MMRFQKRGGVVSELLDQQQPLSHVRSISENLNRYTPSSWKSSKPALGKDILFFRFRQPESAEKCFDCDASYPPCLFTNSLPPYFVSTTVTKLLPGTLPLTLIAPQRCRRTRHLLRITRNPNHNTTSIEPSTLIVVALAPIPVFKHGNKARTIRIKKRRTTRPRTYYSNSSCTRSDIPTILHEAQIRLETV
jgi:hypothetical protein